VRASESAAVLLNALFGFAIFWSVTITSGMNARMQELPIRENVETHAIAMPH
jgi:hypothetical protein